VDTSQRLADLQKDVKYLGDLAQAELEAAKTKAGMWKDSQIRKHFPEVVEEAEFQTNSNVWQKMWRRIRR
jgi:hypothetical protein